MQNKLYFKILLLLCLNINLLAQDKEPTQKTFTINGESGKYLDKTNDYFKINNFTLGWQWGDQYKISKALKMNQKDLESNNTEKINPNTNLFIRSGYEGKSFYSHCYFSNDHIYGKSLKYEPTLYIDPTNVYKLNKRIGDPSNPVFGFRYKRGTITNNQSDPNYSRVIIRGDSLKNQVVLKDNWPNDIMYFIPGDGSPAQNTIEKDYTGRSFYVTINLKRYNGTFSSSPDTPILKIKVPYTIWTSKTNEVVKNAYFYKIPSTFDNAYDLMPEGNGFVWRLAEIQHPIDRPQEIIITEKMLPTDGSSMTISGFIDFAGLVINQKTNNQLKNIPDAKGSDNEFHKIDKLNLEVTYLNSTTEVAIDWVKFESPNARKINQGYYDDYIAESVQRDLNKYSIEPFKSQTIIPKRWIVHIEGNAVHWEAERHFRKIVGDVVLGEVGPSLIAHHDEFVGSQDRWMGLFGFWHTVAVPFMKNNRILSEVSNCTPATINANIWKTQRLQQGYFERIYNVTSNNRYFDRFNSGYETFLRHQTANVANTRTVSLSNYLSENYIGNTSGNMSVQAFWEIGIYNQLVNPYSSGFVYSDKPWFGHSFFQQHVYTDPHCNNGVNENIIILNAPQHRSQTGEETDLILWYQLILGAKGLIYDGGFDYSDQLKLSPKETTLLNRINTERQALNLSPFTIEDFYNSSNISDYDFINSKHSTSDFFNETSYDHILSNTRTIDKSQVANFMGIRDTLTNLPLENRIYVGKRSVRNKIYNVHNWVKANETELMNLKLMAWYGKGFKIWENQHPSLPANENYLSKFIDKENITTRKLFNSSISGNYPNIYYLSRTPKYETDANTNEDFVDVTLLKHSEHETDKIFYIGVQNRRTDPTIYFTEDPNDKHFLFLSSSEFEDMCKSTESKVPDRPSSTITYPASKWQEYWWKKLGCREINIPFDYVSANKEHYNLLKVEELDAEYKTLSGVLIENDNLPFHLQQKYNHKVDTVIGQDGILRLKLQPGQGKILKVTVLNPDLTTFGELDHSNQTKLVAFPVLNPNGSESDKIQYHMVYYKLDLNINKKRVFYRNSLPIKKSDGSENISWNNEILISNDIMNKDNTQIECNSSNSNPENFFDCDFPSIVVRKDGTSNLKAYIVYTCNKPTSSQNVNALIALCVLNVTNKDIVIPISNKVYDYYMASTDLTLAANTSAFGNPVINASKDYNFIAWSDGQKRIMVSYMLPSNNSLSGLLQIDNFNFTNDPNSISQHPCLNTYSSLSSENNCAIVWQQNNINSKSNIFYTRIRVNQNLILEKYTSTNYNSSKLIIQDNIIKLNTNNNYCTKPFVLRDKLRLEYENQPVNKSDYIFWNEFHTNNIFLEYINKSTTVGTMIYNYDLNNDNSTSIEKVNELRVIDFKNSMTGVNLGLPNGVYINGSKKLTAGNLVINFVSAKTKKNNFWSLPIFVEKSTYHFLLGSGFNLNSLNNILLNGTKTPFLKIASQSNQVHLAQHKENNYFDKVWRNRRIYEETNYSPPRIVSNGRYFYKNNVEEKLESEAFVGFRRNANDYSISNPYINNQEVGLALPYIQNPDTTGSNLVLDFTQDTIFSNWFDVDMVGNLNFKCYGFNDTIMKAQIQRQSDNVFFDLNLPISTTDTTGKLGEYTLINGGLNSYRLCFTRLDTNYQYTETLVLDGLPVSDTVMLKSNGSNKQIIDLSGRFSYNLNNQDFNILISPNPVDEVVYLTPLYSNLSNKNIIEIEIFDNLGNVIAKIKTKSGESVEYDTKDLSNGVYFVKCSEFIDEWFLPTLLKTTKFIVNR